MTATTSGLDLSRAARAAAADALAVFIHACRTSDDERVRLEAAKQIRDWAYGRPATQEEAPQPEPTQTNPNAEELFDANFWASWTDTELMFHLLETVREIRARGFEASVPYYAQDADIPLIAPLPPEPQKAEPQREQPVAEVDPQHEQLEMQLDRPLEHEPPEPELPDPSTTTPRSLVPGPGEILIDCPGALLVPYDGHIFRLKPGLQVVNQILANHHIVKKFIVKEQDNAA